MVDDKHSADQMMIEVGLVENLDGTSIFLKKFGEEVCFLIATIPRVSEAHCGYTSLHEYVITILQIFLFFLFGMVTR